MEFSERLDLPSLTQIDPSALEALPADIRAEIRNEYNRRSASPALSILSTEDGSIIDGHSEKIRTTDKGTPLRRITQALAPRNAAGQLPGVYGNIFERCKARAKARSVSIENGPSSAEESSPIKVGIKVKVTGEELKKLGIDPFVFAELPTDLQLEQLSSARFAHSFGKGKQRA